MNTNALDKVKLFFKRDRDLYLAIYRILGFFPHHIEYYRIAFAHRSSEYRNKKGNSLNNERLEFLGDAVLETVVSDIVFRHFSKKREGFLTGTRSKIVQRSTLNQLAEKMGLMELIHVNTATTTVRNNIGGNAFEALMGAIYLDRGFDFCRNFVEKQVLKKYINLDDVAQREENYKSKMLEWSQKHKILLRFRILRSERFKNGSQLFYSVVEAEGIQLAEGKGYSKKESHQRAAKSAFTAIRRNKDLREQVFLAKETREQAVDMPKTAT